MGQVTVDQHAGRRELLDAYDILDTPAEERFDDIVELAREICATPTALVSLVDDERQWFKARAGFADAGTDLSRSVCRHGLNASDLLVIPDLTTDERTRDNPLVKGAPAIRFYAGAPLRVSSGAVLGMLCVIDTVPRPAGLTVEQRQSLKRLARQTVANIELRLHLADRDAQLAARKVAETALALSETRWRDMFESMSEGFLLGEVIRETDGAITSWRYVSVNQAWSDLIGMSADDVIGRDIRDVIPAVEDAWVDEFTDVVRTGRTITFTREVDALDRWYEGRCYRVGDDRFAVIFRNVTEQVRHARRRDALVRISDGIREARTISEMTGLVSEIVGTTLQVTRAGFGRVDDRIEVVDVEHDWTAPGVASVAGRHRFETFGSYHHELARGEQVIIVDPRTDPRTCGAPGALLDIGVGALINIPVRHRGRVVAILIIHDFEPRNWSEGEVAFLHEVADRLEQGVARMEADDQRQVLHDELAHRLKNQLAIVQAVASQTLRQAPDLKAANEALSMRLAALGRAADVLTASSWSSAELHTLVRSAFAPHEGLTGRFRCDGPELTVNAQVALSLTLALHELVTNATKYGALSNRDGHVDVCWSAGGGPDGVPGRFLLTWKETGGPEVVAPSRRGFGSALIERSLRSALRGEAVISFDPSGLVFRIDAPIESMLAGSE